MVSSSDALILQAILDENAGHRLPPSSLDPGPAVLPTNAHCIMGEDGSPGNAARTT